jgi:uncharacterized protein YndB with AHSA1/START domain
MSAATTDGTLETRDGVHALRFERHLAHPIEKVWAALTEPDRMAEWLAAAEVDLVEGGRVRLTWLNTDESGQTAVMNARSRSSSRSPAGTSTSSTSSTCWRVARSTGPTGTATTSKHGRGTASATG